jgi:hypothetical protein
MRVTRIEKNHFSALITCALLACSFTSTRAQNGSAAMTPQAIAPVDLTGYWVAVVTEDWRWRMVTPPKGDYASVPLNALGREVANTWDPDRDAASCKTFGAAGIMRQPLRIQISWEDDSTLRIDSDHGMQTRRFHFSRVAAAGDPDDLAATHSLQGHSVAQWEGNPGGRYEFVSITPELSHLKVVTTNLAPGYLRKNGVPYSENTVLTEYYDYHADFGDEWITVTTIVNDPTYLADEFITSSSFKRLIDDSSWSPTRCQ